MKESWSPQVFFEEYERFFWCSLFVFFLRTQKNLEALWCLIFEKFEKPLAVRRVFLRMNIKESQTLFYF